MYPRLRGNIFPVLFVFNSFIQSYESNFELHLSKLTGKYRQALGPLDDQFPRYIGRPAFLVLSWKESFFGKYNKGMTWPQGFG